MNARGLVAHQAAPLSCLNFQKIGSNFITYQLSEGVCRSSTPSAPVLMPEISEPETPQPPAHSLPGTGIHADTLCFFVY